MPLIDDGAVALKISIGSKPFLDFLPISSTLDELFPIVLSQSWASIKLFPLNSAITSTVNFHAKAVKRIPFDTRVW